MFYIMYFVFLHGNVIYGDAAHDRDAAHPWQQQENQKYI